MRIYEKMKDRLFIELAEIAKKDSYSPSDLEMACKLTTTIKNIYKMEKLEDEMGYSGHGGYGDWQAEGRYSRGNDRSGGRTVRNDRYSMDDGRERFGHEMRSMMSNEAYDQTEREAMQRAYGRY